MPVQVASFLLPKNDNTWYVLEDIFIKGGFRCVADVTTRDAINPLNLKAGMLVYTAAEDSIWKLGQDLSTWTSANFGGGATGPTGPMGPAGPAGEKGDTGATGPAGPEGPAGPKGDEGDAGPQGLKGSQGLPGSVIRQAAGVPGASLGLNGDYYINTLTQDLYYQTNNNYSIIMNLRGATGASGAVGPAGENGVTIRVGAGVPDNALGITGDMYIDSSTDNGYMKNALGVYALQFNLRGQKGDQGDPGPQGPQGIQGDVGPVGPPGERGEQGVQGIQGLKGEQGNIGPAGPAGPKGDPGIQGPQGIKGDIGLTGPAGEKGDQGIKGDKGDIGPAGPAGSTVAHAASHATGAADEITPESIGAISVDGGTVTGDLIGDKTILAKNAFAAVVDLPFAATCTGSSVYVAATDSEYYSNGTTWVKIAAAVTPVIPYDLAFFIAGTMSTASELVGCYLSTRTIFLPIGVPGSLARAKIPPAANAVYEIKINGAVCGSITFLAGNTSGTISWAAAKNLLQGDTLEIHTPAIVDSAISNVMVTLVGQAEAPQGSMQ